MKKAFITIAAVCGFAVLYITMCGPDPATKLEGSEVESGYWMGDFSSKYDAFSGKAEFFGTVYGNLPENTYLVVDILSVAKNGDTSSTSCVGLQSEKGVISWSGWSIHPKSRPHSAWIEAYTMKK